MTIKMQFLFTIIFLTIFNFTNAQIKIAEPEFSGNVVYVNDTIGSGVKLEQKVSSVSSKVNGASFVPVVGLFAGKATSKNIVQGATSPIQIVKKPKTQFIVKVSDNSVDPISIINIFKLTSEKDFRSIELATSKIVGGSKSGEIKFLEFNGKKYGQSSYLIEIENLEAGEYALTLSSRRDIFHLFGIK